LCIANRKEEIKLKLNREDSIMSEEKVEQKTEAKPQTSKKLEDMIKSIEELSVLELSTLVKSLEDKFGVSAQVAVAGAIAAPGAQAAGAAPAEEKTSFTVTLAEIGAQKIQVIKEIRAVTNLGLKEAKDLVESAPKPVKEGATKEEADSIKAKLEAVGAKVELN